MNTAALAVTCFALAIACQLKTHRLLRRGRVTDLTTIQRLFFHVLIPAFCFALGAATVLHPIH